MGMRLTHKCMPLVSCPDPSGGRVWARDYYLAIYPRVTWVASCSLKNPKVTSWLVTFVLYLVATRWLVAVQHLFRLVRQLLVNTALVLVDLKGVLCGASSNMTQQLRRAFVRWSFLLMWFVPTFPGNIPQHLKWSHPEVQCYRLSCQLRKPKMKWRQGDAPFPTRQLLRLVNN